MHPPIQFTVTQNGIERRLFTVRETPKDEIIITPTRAKGVPSGSNDDAIFGGELIPYDNLQFTIHTSDDSPVMNLVHYKKEEKGEGPVRKIVTNALKRRNELFLVYFYASGNLGSQLYDLNPEIENCIRIGSFDASIFTHCHLVCLSSKNRELPRLHPAQFGTSSLDLTNYRLHVISFCILLPRISHKRGLRFVLGRYPENLHDVSDGDLSAMKINSFNDAELLNILGDNIRTTIDAIIPESPSSINATVVNAMRARPIVVAPNLADAAKEKLTELWRAA